MIAIIKNKITKKINETFEDSEFAEIEALKKESNLTWHNFILLLTTHARESIKQGHLEFNK